MRARLMGVSGIGDILQALEWEVDGYLPRAGHKLQRMPLHGGVQPVVDAELRHRHLDLLLERAELLHTQAVTGVRGGGWGRARRAR